MSEDDDQDLQLALALSLANENSNNTTNVNNTGEVSGDNNVPVANTQPVVDQNSFLQGILSMFAAPKRLSDPKMVLVVRTDLKMGVGKIASQCSHAAVMLYEQLSQSRNPLLDVWNEVGVKKVALRISSEEALMEIYRNSKSAGLPACYICDAGRTQIASGSRTVVAVFGRGDDVDKITGHLKLL